MKSGVQRNGHNRGYTDAPCVHCDAGALVALQMQSLPSDDLHRLHLLSVLDSGELHHEIKEEVRIRGEETVVSETGDD